MDFILGRSAAAFTLSAQRLLDVWGEMYFWTFTFKSVPINDEYANSDWNDFHSRLKWHFRNLRGLRVTELHRSHGIHYHALVNMRIPIDRVKRIARGTGRINGENRYLDFGRMEVDKVDDPEVTVAYLCKYLTKTYKDSYRMYHGRRWGTIGGFKHVQCRDIEYDTLNHRNRRWFFGDEQCSYATLMMMQHYSNLWGSVVDWPIEYRQHIFQQKDTQRAEWTKIKSMPLPVIDNETFNDCRDYFLRQGRYKPSGNEPF